MSDVFNSGPAHVRIEGMREFMVKLNDLPVRLQKGVLRKLMRESMKIVRDDARATVPVLASPVIGKDGSPRRLPATVRKALSVRTSSQEARDGNVGVFVNVRPLKGNVYRGRGAGRVLVRKSQSGADNPRDPYYWRWLEFGTAQRTSVKSRSVKDHNGRRRWITSGQGANRGACLLYTSPSPRDCS